MHAFIAVLARVSRTLYALVTAKVYESFKIGYSPTSLTSSAAFKLEETLHRRPSLAELVTSLDITLTVAPPAGVVSGLTHLLSVVGPRELRLHLNSRAHDILWCIRISRLRELYVTSFDLRERLDLDDLSAFIAGASATLEILELPALVNAEVAAFEQDKIPYCPR